MNEVGPRHRSGILLVAGVLASLAGVVGCGSDVLPLRPGRYVADPSAASTPLADATLVIESGSAGASLALVDGTTVMLVLTEVPRSRWPEDCGTNFGASILETKTVAPDPLALGTLSIPGPSLSATCFRGTVALGGGARAFKFSQ